MKTHLKVLTPHAICLSILILINLIYFLPQFQGKQITQNDIVSYNGASVEIGEYAGKKGEPLYWTNAMFGGMPTYMIGISLNNFYLDWVANYLQLKFSYPMGVFLAQMIAFYILMTVLGISPYLSVIGAISFGFTTNNFVLFEAGHNSKLGTIVFNPLVLAGLFLLYQKRKYWLGGILFSVATACTLYANHPQMTYYFILSCIILAAFWIIQSLKEKDFNHLAKTAFSVVSGAALALAASSANVFIALDYSKDTLRGEPILKNENVGQIQSTGTSSVEKPVDGLTWDYAMQWSNNFQDVLSMLIPSAAGGSSNEEVDKGETFTLLKNGGNAVSANGNMQLPLYCGALPFTSGPNYLGASIIFLFLLGFFLEKGSLRWWLLTSFLLTALLSMGKHFSILQSIFFDYLPLYNKFRAPSSILTITPLFLPILGIIGLNGIIYRKYSPDQVLKSLKNAFFITGGILLFFLLFGTTFFGFQGAGDGQLQPQLLTTLIQDRKAFFKADTIRSLILVTGVAAIIYAYIKNWFNPSVAILSIGLVVLFDVWGIGSRYLSKDKFQSSSQVNTPLQERPVDQQIKQAEKSRGDYRVLDLSVNVFNNSTTSYHHNTIGGYHAAKLMRYNDIIEKQISNNNQNVINMLNAKYIIKQDQTVSQNPLACGTAWFIDTLIKVNSPNEEMDALTNFNPQEVAIILDNEFNGYAGNFDPQKDGEISLTQYDPQNLVYTYNTNSPQFAVFSEIWYGPDKGWQAFIDDKPVDHVRVNYILRGLEVPSGKHTISFRFKPVKIQRYITISRAASGLLMVALLGMIGWMGFNFYKNPGEPNPFPSTPFQSKSPLSKDNKPTPKPSGSQSKKPGKRNG
jgi:hypothetical protein